VFDLVSVASQFSSSEVNLNGDGRAVNVFDMVLVGAHFGEVIPSE